MKPGERTAVKGFIVAGLALLLSLMIMIPQGSGDILGQGSLKMTQTVSPPPVIVPPCNVTYKGSTFQWNYTIVNNTMTASLRIHVNFNSSITSEFWNILEMQNPGNLSGSFNVTIVQWAKMGSQILTNETYTKNVSVYMGHTWQTITNPGVRLYNNTESGPYVLYPSSVVSYYIGVIYTEPTYPPSPSNSNSFGEYVDFTFVLHV